MTTTYRVPAQEPGEDLMAYAERVSQATGARMVEETERGLGPYPAFVGVLVAADFAGNVCPIFTREIGERLMADLRERGFYQALYDWGNELFVIQETVHTRTGFFEADADGRYPLNPYGWHWRLA